jgi:hypothetical protein
MAWIRGLTRSSVEDSALAGSIAALTSGAPSTLWALSMDRDVLEATRAAGAMLIPAHSSTAELIVAAAVVHLSISFFWAALLTHMVPRINALLISVIAAAAIAVLDLRIIGPLFPEVHELPFWPQFADHLAWGATVGAVLRWRFKVRAAEQHAP